MQTAPYRLSLALIARDEARCITRCLESVKGVVDEMVVVDTGSVDDTVELARAAGAQVHRIEWPDDFAQARNTAIEHCTGDWILVLDADEFLVDGARTLLELREQEPTFTGMVTLLNDLDEMDAANESRQLRLLPKHVRYEGRIHEQPQHGGVTRPLDVRIGHDGYKTAQKERKAGRNIALLESALVDDPKNQYLRYQMGVEHQTSGDPLTAAKHLRIAYRRSGPTTGDSLMWRHDLVLRLLRVLVQIGLTEEAIDVADVELPAYRYSADMNFEVGQVLLRHTLETRRGATEMLRLVEDCWLTALEIGDTPHLEGAMRGTGSFLAAHNLAALYQSVGNQEAEDRYRALADELLAKASASR